MDGDIDYSRYSRAELEEVLARLDRVKYPRNYENLRRELETRVSEPERETRPPSAPFLIFCYTAVVLAFEILLNVVIGAALFVIYHDPSDFKDLAIRLEEVIFAVLIVGAFLHLTRNYRSSFWKVSVGIALALGALNFLAARVLPSRSPLGPVAAFVGTLALTLLAAGVGRVLGTVIAPRGAPSNNRSRGP